MLPAIIFVDIINDLIQIYLCQIILFIQQMVMKRCHFAFFIPKRGFFLFKKEIECTGLDTFSPIMAISRFCAWQLPFLIPPLHGATKEEALAHQISSFKPMMLAWNIHLLHVVKEKPQFVHRHGQDFYILIPLDETCYGEILQKNDLFQADIAEEKQHQGQKRNLSQVFKIHANHNVVKYGLYHSQPVKKEETFTPRPDFIATFVGAFYDNQDWKVYDIPNGEVPKITDLADIKSVVITGSTASVINLSPEMKEAIGNLRQVYDQSHHLKILGVCYGHQLILNNFGANIVHKGMIAGVEKIIYEKSSLEKHPFLLPLTEMSPLNMSEYHEDQVQTVPAGFELLASSVSCKVESTISQNGRILTTQYHSELPQPYMKVLAEDYESSGEKFLYKLDQTPEQVAKNVRNSETVMGILHTFLKS